MEKTFVMIKPTGLQRNLIGEVIRRIENKGLTIRGLKMVWVTKEQAQKHYDVHIEKPFYNDLVESITAGPSVVLVVEGKNSVAIMRKLAGATDPLKAEPGTLRGDFSLDIRYNLVHTADAVDRALYEMSIYFSKNEILEYDKAVEKFVNS